MKKYFLAILIVLIYINSPAQKPVNKDKVVYKVPQKGFYQDSILNGIKQYEENLVETPEKKYLSVNFDGEQFPTDPDKYTRQWHNSPLSQGSTGTCWCFSSTSFIESEVYRIHKKKVKLSEMYTVYWEYVEKAKYFVDHRGKMFFGEGSEANAVPTIMKIYGAVPESVYSGLLKGQRFHNHSEMFAEIKSFLDDVASRNSWNRDYVVATVKNIMNHYMGVPPDSFDYKGKNYTPLSFMKEYLEINPDDYFCFMSTLLKTYNQKGELEVHDNWWHNDDYYNVHLDDFIGIVKDALQNGYTVAFCGDVSEPGYDRYAEVGIIPTFDIPVSYIDENSREFRIYNHTTTDDHCLHIIGYYQKADVFWFLIKDSASGGFDGPHPGYRFIREDYAKLKILAIMVYKNAARKVLDKIIK